MAPRSSFRPYPALGILVVCLVLAYAPAAAEKLTVTFEAAGYRIVDADNGQQLIEMEGFDYMLVPGKPMLPSRTFMVALPPGATVNSVEFISHGTAELAGTYQIRPAPAYMPMNHDPVMVERSQREWRENLNATYSSDEAYPDIPGKSFGTGGLRKYTYATVAFTPFSYQPQSGRLTLTNSVTVSIDYRPGGDDPYLRKLMRDTKADKQAAELFVNFEQVRPWYAAPIAESSTMEEHDIVIIYDDYLETQAEAWCSGFPEESNCIATAGHIIESSYSGADYAEKIRNYLTEKLAEYGLEWVIILGTETGIPMRDCFPDPTYHYPGSDYCPPTDYYYADLTGDWDSDNDGYFGEYGQDNVDFTPELHVGRIPYSDVTNVQAIIDKIQAFDYDQGDWKHNALLLGAMSNYANEDNSGYARTDGADLMEDMISGMLGDFTYVREYEKAGLDACPYPCEYPLSHTNAITQWANGDFGVVNWWAHGSQYSSSRKWWASDDGDGIPESSEIPWEVFVGKSDAAMLDNDHPSIVFSCSCNNGWPEVDNLARNLLKNGAAGIVASTRVSWYAVGWTSPSWGGNASLDYSFFDYMINGGQRVGEALTSARISHAASFLWWGWPTAANLYDFCLYGNPYTLLEGDEPPCCQIRGDINHDNAFNSADVIYFVDYLWKSGPPPPCMEEADVNGNGTVNSADVIYLVDYFWKTGPAPVPCP